MAEAAPRQPVRLAPALAWAGLAVAAALVALYAARRPIAEQALTGWLQRRGVAGHAQVLAIGPNRIVGALRIGDPARPDLIVERVELGYGLRGLGVQVRTVTLVRPQLRARWHAGRLSAGALDPLIAEFRKRPPAPGAAPPRIVVQDGRVAIATDAGPLALRGDALVEQGRLVRLLATSSPTRLAGRGASAELGAGALNLQSGGGRLQASLDLPAPAVRAADVTLTRGRLRLTLAAPYPDATLRRAAGAVVAHAELTAAHLAGRGQAVDDPVLSAAFTGQASGWIPDFALAGRAIGDLRARAGAAGGGTAGPLRAALTADDLRWTRAGGDALTARLGLTGLVDRYARDALTLTAVKLTARGRLRLDRRRADLQLAASALGRGAWSGLGPPPPGPPDDLAAVRRAARGFRFAAPGVTLRLRGAAASATLATPASLSADTGGVVTVAPRGGGWRLTSAGGGLPRASADVDRLTRTAEGLAAHGALRAKLSLGPVRDGAFDASGTLRLAGGAATFSGERCARFDIARLTFGAQQVRRVAGRLCPAGPPLLSWRASAWRIVGRAEGASAEVPLLQARVAGANGGLELSPTDAQVLLATATVSDTAAARRFAPLRLSGEARLSGGAWRGALQLGDGAGRRLAQLTLRHKVATGAGGVEIATGFLRFAPGGLQPADLSPLAAAIGSPAEGEAAFSGRFGWTATGVASGGVLDVPRLDFQSPAGRVTGLAGRVVFDSLSPLTAAPAQALRAQAIDTPVGPLKDLSVGFGLAGGALTIGGGEAGFGGGRVRVEQLVLPFAGGRARGVVQLDGVQLHDLVEASPFGDRVELQAKVSGRIPFEAQGTKVRVTGGDVHAVEPGRLSIQRAALSAVEADGAVTAPGTAAAAPTDTFTDFAYQAMENLAFTTLDAGVASRSDGRLGVLFHIVGKHDPPQHQEIRLSIFDLIGKKFLGRKLPLPSGTGVDLTLDTTLNLDDLLADYAEYRRLHGSAQVQP